MNDTHKLRDLLFDSELEGRVIAEIKLNFQLIASASTYKEKMAYDRVQARLNYLAKQSEKQLEDQINRELKRLKV